MNRAARLAIGALAAVALASSACTPGLLYTIEPGPQSAIPRAVDGRWFVRNVTSQGRLSAVEVVYCPVVAVGPTVCRSTVAWRAGETRLLDAEPRL